MLGCELGTGWETGLTTRSAFELVASEVPLILVVGGATDSSGAAVVGGAALVGG